MLSNSLSLQTHCKRGFQCAIADATTPVSEWLTMYRLFFSLEQARELIIEQVRVGFVTCENVAVGI
jgi:hypothetical protein